MGMATIDPSQLKTPVTVIYNRNNPSNVHEVGFLRARNWDCKLAFLDLAAPHSGGESAGGVDSAAAEGKQAAAEGQLVVRDASGRVLTGTEAVYAAHAVLGLGPWFKMCRLPGFLSTGTGIRPRR